jgi:hypothetical protein
MVPVNLNGHRRYVAAPATCTLSFDDEASPLYGLEVEMRVRLGVGPLMRFVQAVQNLGADQDEPIPGLGVSAEAIQQFGALAEEAGEYLVSWNMEDPTDNGDSEPVLATSEGWRSRDGMTQVLIFTKWVPYLADLANGSVSVPLASSSQSGESFLEQPETTEPSS